MIAKYANTNVIKHFTDIFDESSQEAGVFAPDRPFQPILMFVILSLPELFRLAHIPKSHKLELHKMCSCIKI